MIFSENRIPLFGIMHTVHPPSSRHPSPPEGGRPRQAARPAPPAPPSRSVHRRRSRTTAAWSRRARAGRVSTRSRPIRRGTAARDIRNRSRIPARPCVLDRLVRRHHRDAGQRIGFVQRARRRGERLVRRGSGVCVYRRKLGRLLVTLRDICPWAGGYQRAPGCGHGRAGGRGRGPTPARPAGGKRQRCDARPKL